MFELEENKTKLLVSELKTGEKSEMIQDFDREKALSGLHDKHQNDEI